MKIVEWLIAIAKCGFPVKKSELLRHCSENDKRLGHEDPFQGRPSRTSPVYEILEKASGNFTEIQRRRHVFTYN